MASKGLRELRVILCQSSKASAGAREFVAKQYAKLAESSPHPVLVRECSGVQARLLGRYAFGREVTVPVDGLSADEIAAKAKAL